MKDKGVKVGGRRWVYEGGWMKEEVSFRSAARLRLAPAKHLAATSSGHI